jgi:hypothetical protein
LLQEPELANVSNNIILYLSLIVSDDANQSILFSQIIRGGSCLCKLFSQNISHPFSRQTIRVTAMTGAAAMEIGGVTTASEFHYMQNKSYATQDEIDHKETRLNIIDEVSFAGYHTALVGTSHFLQKATECNEHGKLPCVFLVILPT